MQYAVRRYVLGAIVLCVGMVGCDTKSDSSSTQAKRVIILTNGDDPFWDAMRAGMEDAAKELNLEKADLRAEMDKNDGTDKGQADKLKQYANQADIAAVAISVIDPRNVAVADGMRALRKQGVRVITIDSDVDRESASDARFAYIGTDNKTGGLELGAALKGLLPDGGEFVTFVGHKSADNAVQRITGCLEGAGGEFKHHETFGDEMDLSVADKNVKDALARYPEIDALVGIWAYNANAIAQNVGAGPDRPTVVVFDAAPLAIGHMENGKIDALVVQNPYDMGYRGTRLMKALVEDDEKTIREMLPDYDSAKNSFGSPDGDQIITGLKIVVPDDGSPLKKEMFRDDTQFLTLSEFKKWLNEHNLTGS